MTTDELNKNRYDIVLNALRSGLFIDYKCDWQLYFEDGNILQRYINPKNGQVISHKSAVTLSDFFSFIEGLTPERLKRLFGDTRLIQLQNRLIKENKESQDNE